MISKVNRSDGVQFIKEYCDFSDPDNVWILSCIARNKENEQNNIFFKREIIRTSDYIEQAVLKLKALATLTTAQQNHKPIYRLYISLNSRNTRKAMFSYAKTAIDIISAMGNDGEKRYSKMDTIWLNELAKSCHRGTKNFLIDVDNFNDDEHVLHYCEVLNNAEIAVKHCRATPSGYAIVVKACNPTFLYGFATQVQAYNKPFDIDVQTDSMVFVEQFK
jgi:hypothetical protein